MEVKWKGGFVSLNYSIDKLESLHELKYGVAFQDAEIRKGLATALDAHRDQQAKGAEIWGSDHWGGGKKLTPALALEIAEMVITRWNRILAAHCKITEQVDIDFKLTLPTTKEIKPRDILLSAKWSNRETKTSGTATLIVTGKRLASDYHQATRVGPFLLLGCSSEEAAMGRLAKQARHIKFMDESGLFWTKSLSPLRPDSCGRLCIRNTDHLTVWKDVMGRYVIINEIYSYEDSDIEEWRLAGFDVVKAAGSLWYPGRINAFFLTPKNKPADIVSLAKILDHPDFLG